MGEHFMHSNAINLISADASRSISSTDKIFHLGEIVKGHHNTYFSIAVTNFSMPYTFYDVSSFRDNNTFDVAFYDGATTESVTITIPDGNYNTSSLIDIVNTQFTTALGSLSLSTLYMTINQDQTTFSVVLAPSRTTITFSNIKLFKEMGFENSDDYAYSSTTTCEMPKTFNLAGDACFYIRLANKSFGNINSRNVSGIICCIDNDYMHGEVIYYRTNNLQFFKVEDTLETLHIQILNENMQPIGDINNSASFRISFALHYRWSVDTVPKLPSIVNETNINNKIK
jgi:hypothetical protein